MRVLGPNTPGRPPNTARLAPNISQETQLWGVGRSPSHATLTSREVRVGVRAPDTRRALASPPAAACPTEGGTGSAATEAAASCREPRVHGSRRPRKQTPCRPHFGEKGNEAFTGARPPWRPESRADACPASSVISLPRAPSRHARHGPDGLLGAGAARPGWD